MGKKTFYDNKYLTQTMSDYEIKVDDYKNMKMWEQLNKYIKVNEDWDVLDIGCAMGRFLAFIPFKNKYGVDISNTALNKSRNKGFQVYQCDIEHDRLPFESDSMDLIFCLEVLEHLFNEQNAIDEIKRVLKPEGYLYATLPNDILRFDRRFGVLFGKLSISEDSGHLRFFDTKKVGELFERHNLEIIYNGALPLSYKTHSLGWLGTFLSNNFPDLFATNYSVICQNQGGG